MAGEAVSIKQVGLPFAAHSDTSRAAAESMTKHFSKQQKRLYLWARLQRQGFTDEEGAAALKMNPSSFRPRRGELVAMGRLRDTTQRKPTQSGRQATVWVVC